MDQKTCKGAAYVEKGKMEIVDVPMPQVGDDDILIKIEAVGICGSDVHYAMDGRLGKYETPKGFILGHEAAGVVCEVGKNVTDRKVGDRVAIEPGYACGKCKYCREGKYNLCDKMIFMAHPDPVTNGAMREYISWPAYSTFLLPDSMTFAEGAMIEPLNVALQALKNSRLKAADTVVIFSAGPIGLMCMLAAKAYGACKVIVVERTQYRLEAAKEMGADVIINSSEEDIVEAVRKETGGMGADVFLECSGAQQAYDVMADCVRKGGMITLVGLGTKQVYSFNAADIINKEITITSVMRYDNLYEKAIRLVEAGLVDVNKLVTHRLKLEDAEKGMDMMYRQLDGSIKIVLEME